MNTSPEKFLASAKSSAEARVNEIAAASDSVLSAVEHLTALNLNTTRAVLDDAIALGQAVAAARDPKALFELQIGAVSACIAIDGGGDGRRGDVGCRRWLGIGGWVHCSMLIGGGMRSI